MAFNILNWGKVSANINPGLNAMWGYNAYTCNQTVADPSAVGDTIADTLVSGYFNERLGLVNVGDLIMVYATDGNAFLVVTGASTTITTSLYPNVVVANNSITTAMLQAASVTLAKLATGIAPSHVAKFGGKITWSGSGASLATTVTGVAATDIVIATLENRGTQGTTFLQVVPTTNTLTATISTANTSNDLIYSYIVFRAAS